MPCHPEVFKALLAERAVAKKEVAPAIGEGDVSADAQLIAAAITEACCVIALAVVLSAESLAMALPTTRPSRA